MSRPPQVGWFIFASMIIIIFIAIGLGILISYLYTTGFELILGLMIILGVSVLTVLLFIMASAFYALGLANPQEALGLPPGSVRAMIALLLIIIWAIVSIFIFRSIATGQVASQDAIKLGQQIFTTMSTLAVAGAAFYFGTNRVLTARRALVPGSSPLVIQSINPTTGVQEQELVLTNVGKGFQSPQVRLVRGTEEIIATDILSNAAQIQCKIKVDKKPDGKWDVIVVNEDGGQGQIAGVFQITASVAPPANP
jgi:hypothetical protein